jgi:hypothetical protein
VALERRLSTLFTTLRHCLGAPPTNQPARAVPVPIPHLLDLIARVVALSPVSAHFVRLLSGPSSLAPHTRSHTRVSCHTRIAGLAQPHQAGPVDDSPHPARSCLPPAVLPHRVVRVRHR